MQRREFETWVAPVQAPTPSQYGTSPNLTSPQASREAPKLSSGSRSDLSMANLQEQLRAVLLRDEWRVVDLFRSWDKNNDGAVSKKEFRAAMEALNLSVNREAIDGLFESIDRDLNGKIDYAELRDTLRQTSSSRSLLDPSLQPGGGDHTRFSRFNEVNTNKSSSAALLAEAELEDARHRFLTRHSSPPSQKVVTLSTDIGLPGDRGGTRPPAKRPGSSARLSPDAEQAYFGTAEPEAEGVQQKPKHKKQGSMSSAAQKAYGILGPRM